MAAEDNESLRVGHDSAGNDCTSKVFEFGKKGTFAGGFFGAVEACFLPAVPVGQPVFMKALTLTLGRCLLGGFAGGLFAGSACLSASIRDEDDYKNAAVGGAIAGSVFGIASRSLPIGLCTAAGLSITMGAIKYMHGTYLPQLPSRTATTQAPDVSYIKPRPTGRIS